jgi:hypothetical protein
MSFTPALRPDITVANLSELATVWVAPVAEGEAAAEPEVIKEKKEVPGEGEATEAKETKEAKEPTDVVSIAQPLLLISFYVERHFNTQKCLGQTCNLNNE